MSQQLEGIHNRLMQELECPVCKEFMVPPIMMCDSGHNLCCNCRVTMEKCPICKGKFLKVRNLSLESIASETLFQCRNASNGCISLLSTVQVKEHESQCLYDRQKCPFEKFSAAGCNWFGSLDRVKNHVESDHKGSCVQHVSRKFKSVLHSVSRQQRYYKAVITLGELFYVSWRIQGGIFYCAVFYIGSQESSSNFRYRFSITTKDFENISASAITHSYFDNMNDIIRQGSCAMIDYSFVQRSTTEHGDLPFRMEISQLEN